MLGEVASLADNLERSHVSGGKLPFDTEATSTFHRRDAEVNMISGLKKPNNGAYYHSSSSGGIGLL